MAPLAGPFSLGEGARKELTEWEARDLAIVGLMLGADRRNEKNENVSLNLRNFSEIVAIIGRHVARATFGTIVVAHTGPFVVPFGTTAIASIVVVEPSHARDPD